MFSGLTFLRPSPDAVAGARPPCPPAPPPPPPPPPRLSLSGIKAAIQNDYVRAQASGVFLYFTSGTLRNVRTTSTIENKLNCSNVPRKQAATNKTREEA